MREGSKGSKSNGSRRSETGREASKIKILESEVQFMKEEMST